MRRHTRRKIPAASLSPVTLLEDADVSLLDVIDHVLNQGVVISGELTLGVADVDLIYVRLLALVCSADRVLSSAAGSGAASTVRAERRGA